MQHITIPDFIARYKNRQAAATALGVDSITLWRWRKRSDHFPEPWGYKAQALTQNATQTAGDGAGDTIS
jgi:hypothetical protein